MNMSTLISGVKDFQLYTIFVAARSVQYMRFNFKLTLNLGAAPKWYTVQLKILNSSKIGGVHCQLELRISNSIQFFTPHLCPTKECGPSRPFQLTSVQFENL
jgi:hypothetical protein